MSSGLILSVIFIYFAVLLAISWITSRNADSESFFVANRQAPWYLVAFGMIGTSLSGVTFISVPGAVGAMAGDEIKGFAYFQLVLGYVVGYFVIATVLMPLYYRLNLISIYSYLEDRFGYWAYKTGSFFFLVSRAVGSSLRLYLAAMVLHLFLFEAWGVPFVVTVAITILLIWLYTFKGGIKTIVWTDTFQTFFLVTAVLISVYMISDHLGWSLFEMVKQVGESAYSKTFFTESIWESNNFFKQFLSGAFIALVMTGLDQDLMQKNLSCRNLKDAQKNMLWFTVCMVFVNLLFLTLGAMLYIYATSQNIAIPADTDELYPMLALNHFGIVVGIFFLLGITASTYASSDSALAALTTSFCIDFLNFKSKPESVKQKQKTLVHIGFSLLFLLIIVVVYEIGEKSVIHMVLKAASYTYGPLLGLFAFGVLSKRKVRDKFIPLVCVLAPLATFFLTMAIESNTRYQFAYENLIINGFICFLGLLACSYSPNTKVDEKVDTVKEKLV
ncbi:sodium:solute symporter [Cytophagaceae bacterium ABcell3]|nr:sodium:solute symporter [Cytophagaceae bacterium ABcell3]